eukprot:RCo034051
MMTGTPLSLGGASYKLQLVQIAEDPHPVWRRGVKEGSPLPKALLHLVRLAVKKEVHLPVVVPIGGTLRASRPAVPLPASQLFPCSLIASKGLLWESALCIDDAHDLALSAQRNPEPEPPLQSEAAAHGLSVAQKAQPLWGHSNPQSGARGPPRATPAHAIALMEDRRGADPAGIAQAVGKCPVPQGVVAAHHLRGVGAGHPNADLVVVAGKPLQVDAELSHAWTRELLYRQQGGLARILAHRDGVSVVAVNRGHAVNEGVPLGGIVALGGIPPVVTLVLLQELRKGSSKKGFRRHRVDGQRQERKYKKRRRKNDY